jgi:hypothetical protein
VSKFSGLTVAKASPLLVSRGMIFGKILTLSTTPLYFYVHYLDVVLNVLINIKGSAAASATK